MPASCFNVEAVFMRLEVGFEWRRRERSNGSHSL
jgi:hypothetical protein